MQGFPFPRKAHEYYDNVSWVSFPRGLKRRNALSLKKWRRQLAPAIEKEIFLQYIFQKQWQAVKAYANEKGISVIGDAPIFVSYDSADVWAHQKLFRLDSKGFPTCVTGVPPDYFSETGQLWGNRTMLGGSTKKQALRGCFPVYKRICRMSISFALTISAAFPPAGRSHLGQRMHAAAMGFAPGEAFFTLLKEKLGSPLPLIAEDLGIITDEVAALRDFAGLPGMRILQFAFGQEKNNPYLPHCYDKNTVVYTGTHDNDTTNGWYQAATEQEKDHYRRYLNVDGSNAAWDFIRLALSSPADTAILPLQDVLSLGTEHRMNIPGTPRGNWGFTFSFDWWQEGFSEGLRYLSAFSAEMSRQKSSGGNRRISPLSCFSPSFVLQ